MLNKPRPHVNWPRRISQVPNQRPIITRETGKSNQEQLVGREQPQKQPRNDVDNTTPPLTNNEPVAHDPTPIRHFEPSPLSEIPQQAREPQETTKQNPIPTTEYPYVIQDPFDTQMEVPFSEDIVEPVFKRPEMTDFEIPPVLEEMIPDGTLIHKHLPK